MSFATIITIWGDVWLILEEFILNIASLRGFCCILMPNNACIHCNWGKRMVIFVSNMALQRCEAMFWFSKTAYHHCEGIFLFRNNAKQRCDDMFLFRNIAKQPCKGMFWYRINTKQCCEGMFWYRNITKQHCEAYFLSIYSAFCSIKVATRLKTTACLSKVG